MALTSPGQRLEYFIHERFKGNKSAFARAAGIGAPSLISDYCANEKEPSGEKMDGMARAGLNLIWYRFGIGEMDFNPESDTERGRQQRADMVREATEAAKALVDILERLAVV